MAILSGFKSFERYMPSNDGENWQLVSMRTNAKDIIFDDGKNLEDKLGGLSFLLINKEDYEQLITKDSSVLYIVCD